MSKALDIYRKSSLVSYQADDGPEIEFENLNWSLILNLDLSDAWSKVLMLLLIILAYYGGSEWVGDGQSARVVDLIGSSTVLKKIINPFIKTALNLQDRLFIKK